MFLDLLEVLSLAGLSTSAVVLYLIFVRKPSGLKGHYNEPGWNYPLKLLWSRYAVRKWKAKLLRRNLDEYPLKKLSDGWDSVVLRASAPDGTALMLGIRKLCGRKPLAEITVFVKLLDGTIYRLPQHPETAIGAWEDVADGWSAGGLKIQVIEPERLRLLYNGLLIKDGEKSARHVKLNFIWSSATSAVRFPEDWSNSLAAQALALEPWRDGLWADMLKNLEDRSWLQWGAIQGRFQALDDNGAPVESEYLRMRGIRERCWNFKGYKGLRRIITIIASASDGTAVQIRAMSYKNTITQCISGCVRFPDYTIESITSTDLVMSDFCETPNAIPSACTINVSTSKRTLRVILRINADGGDLFSGVPRGQETVFRTVLADINGRHGTGILELGYEATDNAALPSVRLSPPKYLKWLNESEAGTVGYCLAFEERAAACSELVGGKAASLALLVSVQNDEGYRVPPGFCLTSRAWEKHLDSHPELTEAIVKIQDANENYEESHFKKLCSEASELIASTEITSDVKQEVLTHLKDLRHKAAEQGYGPDLRFAVRSSAVGEDSEALSAAGQNETILGCKDDDQVLRGLQKCWASMFAFTSVYYRRQNGQRVWCGCGAAVQALAGARAAGVLFSRHPAAGDPARLLITANYGLGESVVSGAVEPDTIVVKRDGDQLAIDKIVVGSKTQRVTAGGEGVSTEDVPDDKRSVACLTEAEILRLARIGVSQEELWGAARDIEWAIGKDEIYLLQARPITSLERWTEEELLHEMDFPIMADDELTTFANTGEVLPKPFSPLSYDLVNVPLSWATYKVICSNGDGYDKSIVVTHNRFILALYNSTYRRVPDKIDVGIRMLDMSIHGHKVATDDILQTALHRRPSNFFDRILMMLRMIKKLFWSKKNLNYTIKTVANMKIDTDTNDPHVLLNRLVSTEKDMQQNSLHHHDTSSASTFSQFIAMSVLLEGKQDFTLEQCNEIGTLLSSGDVLSAEVPHELAKLARLLDESGRVEEFRAQDPKNAFAWLEQNLPEIHRNVNEFLEQHGYRAIMEFDLVTKPWVLVPEELMNVLAQMRLTKGSNSPPAKSDEELINSLKSPQKSSTRKVLRWILPLCRRTVRHREGTKAALILGVHKLRLAARRLARLLVAQWYLPHLDLVFFFRLHELRKFIDTRDPALLKKAIQRQQYYDGWCKLKFAELNTGWVEPLKVLGPQVTSGDVKLEATPACGGEVVARACVVKDLSEIGELKQGDVLITHSTDIGWSPYFPLLSGIVTELGGLISHGAVIAREYGLPCIVGAVNATQLFKTGDTVRLTGTTGTVERVHVAKTDENQS
ncbi:rifampicin phosphotransferase-like [Epargyreus clarus]|uniref:rifampicin phosphotransferase-like n=1 Tax=Epargyreus clarus TaxID=520877 RepID=UPI003C2E7B80